MTSEQLLKKHLSDLGKKGAKARVKKHGKGIYAEMARKRWAKQAYPIDLPKLSGQRDRVREAVRIRDAHTCRFCKRQWKPGTRRFDVHHLDATEEGTSHETCAARRDFKNMHRLVTLCRKCHLGLDSVRARMRTSAQQLMHS